MSKSIPTVNDVRIAAPLTALDREVIRCLMNTGELSARNSEKLKKESERYKRARTLIIRALKTMQEFAP